MARSRLSFFLITHLSFKNILSKSIKNGLLFFLAFSFGFTLMAQDFDIKLRVNDGSEIVPIAVRPDGSGTSKLKIAKDGSIYEIQHVPSGNHCGSGVGVRIDGVTRELKKYTSGDFARENARPKFGKRWIATITCADASGTPTIIGQSGFHRNGKIKGNPGLVRQLVRNAIVARGLPITAPSDEVLVGADGGTGRVWTWNDDATPHLPTLNAVCSILGYASYVSSTCLDQQTNRQYRNGKCNFHTPHNNYMWRWTGGSCIP